MPLSKLQNYLRAKVEGKRVAILGFGREGQSTYRTIRESFPELSLTVIDQAKTLPGKASELLAQNGQTHVLLGAQSLGQLSDFDIIFKSPGVSPFLLEIQDAISRGVELTSQTDIFFALFGPQIIAVTGTKGKSTASAVLFQVLSQAGKDVLFIGNIGAPAFDALSQVGSETLIVYETSSHQCEGLSHAPHIGVFLNLFADHLDYYPSLEAYGQAKRQLFVSQKPDDICLYNTLDPRVAELVDNLPGQKLGFSLAPHSRSVVFLQEDWIVAHGEKLMPTREVPLPGKHNLLNVMPTVIVALKLGVTSESLRGYLHHVTPVEKRLETVGKVGDVTFVDDALATIPEATVAALDTLGDSVETLIAGGFDRGQDFTELIRRLTVSSVKTLILFPTTGEKIASLLAQHGSTIAIFPVKTMKDAVKIAIAQTHPGKTVLLSSASASFGLFADYRDRSEQLWQALKEEGMQVPPAERN